MNRKEKTMIETRSLFEALEFGTAIQEQAKVFS